MTEGTDLRPRHASLTDCPEQTTLAAFFETCEISPDGNSQRADTSLRGE
ncbi:hypothetical protein [Halorussus halophilus]|nr:hypothetical protein [Halorussus halophilus]